MRPTEEEVRAHRVELLRRVNEPAPSLLDYALRFLFVCFLILLFGYALDAVQLMRGS